MIITFKYQHPLTIIPVPTGTTVVTVVDKIVMQNSDFILMPIRFKCFDGDILSQRLGKSSVLRTPSEFKDLFNQTYSIIALEYPTEFTL